jgi:hypothetical protein
MIKGPLTDPASVEIQQIDDVAVLCASGNFCGAQEGVLRGAMVDVLHTGSRSVIIDISDVSNMDSNGMCDLASALLEARGCGARYACVIPVSYDHGPYSAPFEVFESCGEALDSLRWDSEEDL